MKQDGGVIFLLTLGAVIVLLFCIRIRRIEKTQEDLREVVGKVGITTDEYDSFYEKHRSHH
jgi:hypothetical protein